MADKRASQWPAVPPCVTCNTIEQVSRLQTPGFPHIHYYQCVKCGLDWATGLDGKLILINANAKREPN